MTDAYMTSSALTEFHATLVANSAILAATDYTNNAMAALCNDCTMDLMNAKALDMPIIPAVDHATETEGTALEYKQFSASKKTLTKNVQKGVVMAFYPNAISMANQDVFSSYGAQIGADAGKILDGALTALYSSAATSIDAGTGADIDEDDVLNAKEDLVDANAPVDGRVLVVHQTQENALKKISRFSEAQMIGGSGNIAAGRFIGRIHGFEVYMDQNIVATTDGYRHNLAFVKSSGNGAAFASRSTMAFAWGVLPAPTGGAITAQTGAGPRITFSYDAKIGSDVIDSRFVYGVVAHRPEWLVDIKTADTKN